MNKRERKALEAAGFRIGDAEDFLELTDEERRLVDLRVAVSRAIRARREQQGLTQQQVAKRLQTSQPRVAMIEAGASTVSLDSMFRGLFILGGGLEDVRGRYSIVGTQRGSGVKTEIRMGATGMMRDRAPSGGRARGPKAVRAGVVKRKTGGK
jgi:predicted XRE-type DNA-binding protein